MISGSALTATFSVDLSQVAGCLTTLRKDPYFLNLSSRINIPVTGPFNIPGIRTT